MREVSRRSELRAALRPARQREQRIALVPTMGALHQGHLTLVDVARQHADVVVMSVFVNPLQFRPGEDFERYPRPIAQDRALAESRGVDLLFTPTVEEMYPGGGGLLVTAGEDGARWEGAVRPGHFDGVLTVVAKLFNLVQPTLACFGQKDIQQVTLVRQMVAQLDFPLELLMVPTVREPDGLALSSRNAYLSDTDRRDAVVLSRALRSAAARWEAGERSAEALRAQAERVIAGTPSVRPDYLAVVDAERMLPVSEATEGTIIAVAARVGPARLIDNIILGQQNA